MTPIRVLIVDDSATARRAIVAALKVHPEIEVAGVAPNGTIALSRLDELSPDAVVLDVEMPGLDGVETLKRIRQVQPRLPVIMFSALTERGAMVTVQALAAGASDYVTKPSALQGTAPETVVGEQLVPKLLALCDRGSSRKIRLEKTKVPSAAPVLPSVGAQEGPRKSDVERLTPAGRIRAASGAVRAVVIASSTGGPNALAELIPTLPADLDVPVFVVQHMPPIFTRHLAERLDSAGNLRVREAQGGERPGAGEVWIAPGDYHLELFREERAVTTRLTQGPRENSCRPAADVLFRSAAAVYGSGVLGVVLTGMGQDGLEGCRMVTKAGGRVIVQDEASCVVWGMPKAVERAGLASVVCPLQQVAGEIMRHVVARAAVGGGA